jgi:hypothetical protein
MSLIDGSLWSSTGLQTRGPATLVGRYWMGDDSLLYVPFSLEIAERGQSGPVLPAHETVTLI